MARQLVYNLDERRCFRLAKGQSWFVYGMWCGHAGMMSACLQAKSAVTAPTPLNSPALAAFIRGVERRALVVAEFQSGEVLVAERAVAVAMRAFVPAVADLPMNEWPGHFWRLLGSTPQLRQPAEGGAWPQDLVHLMELGEGERLALLLRIGAGLDEAQAAHALGVDTPVYCQWLAQACPRDASGQPDALAWRSLAESVQARVRELSPERQAQLERLRDSLVSSGPQAPVREPTAPVMQAERREQRRAPVRKSRASQWLWLLTGAVLLAGIGWAWLGSSADDAATAQSPQSQDAGLEVENPVQTESLQELELPPAAAPASVEPVVDPGQASLLEQADFLAWLAAGGPLPVDESREQPHSPAPQALALASGAGQAH